MKPRLPPALRVIERGWLSANNIVFLEGENATLIDSGYVSQAAQTLSLVREALDGRRLERIVNTHSHSDHVGGNAALGRAYGCGITIPAGIADAVDAWDEEFLLLAPAGQSGERFRYDAVLRAGDQFELGGMLWDALAAPGHDMEALVFYCASKRLLISGDALWRDGFGIQFAEIAGTAPGLAATKATLEAIGRLSVDLVIPGHGAPFAEFDDAMKRAMKRVEAFAEDPSRMVRNAMKALFIFKLLEVGRLRADRLAEYLSAIPYFLDVFARLEHASPEALAARLIEDLSRAGVIVVRDGDILPTQTA